MSRASILVLCKRRPQQRDLLSRPYGRFYHLPQYLAQTGKYKVTVLLADYQGREPETLEKEGMLWLSEPVLLNPLRYVRHARELSEDADIVVGFSDTWFGILAQSLAQRAGSRSLLDAYDNYESYIPWARPLHWRWRRALRGADAITAAGAGLLQHMAHSSTSGTQKVIPMAADDSFVAGDKQSARAALGLPLNATLVGYIGSAVANRGTREFCQMLDQLVARHPEIQLVFAGRQDNSLSLPDGALHLGYLPDDQMPQLINAMDVCLAYNRLSAFGNFSYPVKVYEAAACGVPVLASRTPATEWIFRDHPDCLFNNDDTDGFTARLRSLLDNPQSAVCSFPNWHSVAEDFEQVVSGLVSGG